MAGDGDFHSHQGEEGEAAGIRNEQEIRGQSFESRDHKSDDGSHGGRDDVVGILDPKDRLDSKTEIPKCAASECGCQGQHDDTE